MNYKDINLDEPILSKEQADNLAKRNDEGKHSDLSKDFEKAKNATGALFNVLGTIGKAVEKQSYPSIDSTKHDNNKNLPVIDSQTAGQALEAAKKVIPSEETQAKLKDKAKELGKGAQELAHNAKELIKGQIDIDSFTTDALALLFLALEAAPPLLFLVINRVFLILSIVFSFFILIAVAIIVVCYLIIKKYKDSLKGSTSAIVLEIIMSITEGMIIVSFSIVGEDAFIAAYAILLVSLISASILADNLKDKYTDTNGIRMAIIMVANMVFVLFNVLNTNLIECGLAAAITYIYLAFAISTLHEVVKETKEKNCKKSASFATLIVFERKVEIGYRAVVWIVRWVREMNEKRKAAGQSDPKAQPLLSKSAADGTDEVKVKVEKTEKVEKNQKSNEHHEDHSQKADAKADKKKDNKD
jgi:hypothetical protein